MRRSLRALVVSLVGMLTLTACDFSVYDLPLPGGADVGDNSYAVKVQFTDVLDLVPQSAVKVDDVTVGRVDDVSLDGYTAIVTVRLHGDVQLPENAWATIRQTSLLGEKFVSLGDPVGEAPSGVLAEGDTIPLSRSGRNPEVEEVLAALSLLLNGGGVAQLKTISQELNNALTGNESEIKSVLGQLDTFMTQIDKNKEDIVAALRSVNKLAIEVKAQEAAIIRTLDDLPEALEVIDEQRTGLKKMLRGLQRLSPVAIRVIKASKADTIANLRELDPILTQVANAGDAIPKALQVFLTYPFVDAAVGRSPTEARNLHQGDYTNLSAQLDLDLNNLPEVPGLPDPCDTVPDLPICDPPPLPDPCDVVDELPLPATCPTLPTNPTDLPTTLPTLPTLPTDLPTTEICQRMGIPCEVIRRCLNHPERPRCEEILRDVCERRPNSDLCEALADAVCSVVNVPGICDVIDLPGGGGAPQPTQLCGPPLNLCRPPPREFDNRRTRAGYDEDLALLLMQGVLLRERTSR